MSTTPSSNYTTLYSGNANPVVPTTGYGNANVVSLLAVGSDGANTVTNIVATGNITGNYFIGNGSQLTGIVANASYGDSNVVTLMAAFGSNVISTTGNITGGNIRTAGVVSATGNITGNYILGNGSQLTGLPATYGNANVATYLASGTLNSNIITTANVQGAFLTTSGASGNITGVNYMSANFYLGDGGLLSNVGGTYSNANVSNFLANFGSNSISTSGNVTAGYFVGNGSLLTSITGANVTGTVANATFATSAGSATTALTANTVTDAAQANITSVGVLTSLSVSGNTQSGNILTVGQVSATGNVAGNFFIGNGSQLTGIAAGTYGNANVSDFLANGFGSNTISTIGNVTAGYFLGNGSQLTGIAGGSPAGNNLNFQYNNSGSFGGVPNTFFYSGNGTIEIASAKFEAGAGPSSQITVPGAAGYVSVVGNVIAGNILTTGVVSATGNVNGNYFIGNGSQLTGIAGTTPGGTANSIQFNSGNTFAGIADAFHYTGNGITEISKVRFSSTASGGGSGEVFVPGTVGYVSVVGNIIGGNILTAGVVSATGNVAGNFFIGNGSQLTGISGGGGSPGGANTQIQFNDASAFGGNANLTFNNSTGNVNLGNVIFTTSNVTNFINTVTPHAGTPAANATAFNSSQIIIGNGWQGNLNLNNQTGAVAMRASKLLYWDTIPITDSGGPRVAGIGSNPFIQLQGNVSNTNSRLAALGGSLVIGGTANNFQYTTSSQFAAVGTSTGVTVGQASTNIAIGNTTVNNMVGVVSNMQVNGASNVGNSSGFYSALTPATAAYVQTAGGLVIQFGGTASVASDNVFGVYMNGNTSAGIFGGINNTNSMRKATNYYFLRNDDNLAQNKLGSLRLFNEYQYDNTSSAGTLTVDKNNGQVQSVVLTEAITTVTFSNFVTSASDGTTTDYQTDTVTLILRQGATPYAVTMPTGSAYRYAAGTTTVGATANTTTMISVTANYDSISAADQYLITISPEFS